jgi:hypothetical protein
MLSRQATAAGDGYVDTYTPSIGQVGPSIQEECHCPTGACSRSMCKLRTLPSLDDSCRAALPGQASPRRSRHAATATRATA